MELGAIEREKERDLSSHPGMTELQTIMNARTSVLIANLKSPSPGINPAASLPVSANFHLVAFAPDRPSGRQQQGASGPGRTLAEVALATPLHSSAGAVGGIGYHVHKWSGFLVTGPSNPFSLRELSSWGRSAF